MSLLIKIILITTSFICGQVIDDHPLSSANNSVKSKLWNSYSLSFKKIFFIRFMSGPDTTISVHRQ